MKCFTALCLILCLSISIYGQENTYQFSRIDIDDGLSHNQINSIIKDNKGFLWFGTLSGLNRFDGYGFKVFRSNSRDTLSISDNYINDIFEGPDNKLWILTRNGLNIYDQRTESFSRNAQTILQSLSIPNDSIITIYKDRKARYWFLLNNGIYLYDSADKSTREITPLTGSNKSISTKSATAVQEDSRGNIWLIHRNGLLDMIDPVKGEVKARSMRIASLNKLRNHTYSMKMDAEDKLWIYSRNDPHGILYYDPADDELKHYHSRSSGLRLNTDIVRGIETDLKGRIWVATDHGGVNIIDKKQNRIEYILNREDEKKSLAQNTVNVMYKDPEGIIWLGSYKKGLSYYHENIIKFSKPLIKDPEGSNVFSEDVNSFVEDDQGNIWIGANGGGLIYYNRKTGKSVRYENDPADAGSISSNIIISLCLDHKNRLWIGTYYGGLNMFDGKKFHRFKHIPGDTNSIADDRIYQVFEDSKKNLWIGTLGAGLDRFDEKTGSFIHYRAGAFNSIHSDYISSIEEDRDGNLWIGSAHGIDFWDRKKNRFTFFTNAEGNERSLSNNNVIALFNDSRGWIWSGTREGLNLFNKQTGDFSSYTLQHGLPDNLISAINEDNRGNIWVSTSNGLSQLIIDPGNPQQPVKKFKNYDELDGLQGKVYNVNATAKTSSGELIFGGAGGFNFIRPENLVVSTRLPPVLLTDFQVFNRSIRVNEAINDKVLLTESITSSKKIIIPHSENFFSIEFAALSFFHPDKNQYKYKLEGFNEDWLTADAGSRKATFTNLDPGDYTFRVIASNSDGLWNQEGASLQIRILPPFYKSPLAFFLYLVILIGALWLARRLLLERERMNFRIHQEREEANRMHALDMMKIRFFTNVSHEFRTPLTLILSPLDKIIAQSKDPDQQKHFQLIKRNARRLLNLVNQLLDFRRMEVQELTLNVQQGEIISFVEEVAESFSDLSEKKNIHFSFRSNISGFPTLFDHDKLEKILFNLLSNAFKFTQENGEVDMEINFVGTRPVSPGEKGTLEIKVRDTGIGIPLEKQEKIFERFFQHDVPGSMVSHGSGIGLALTREFVKLHEGTIRVESEPEKGSCFILTLPLVFSEAAISDLNIEPPIHESGSLKAVQPENAKVRKKPVLLLVEDNEDFRFYLKDNLGVHFNVLEARDGKTGWKIALQQLPDLIVSDVSMPFMDGIELCKKLRSDPRTVQIPVILLTARSAEEQQLEGLVSGANDYITKPFNFELLLSKIRNLIQQRNSIVHATIRHQDIKVKETNLPSMEDKFMQQAMEVVEKNISNAEFSVEEFSRELCMSRVGLYKKLISITGSTPIEFIRKVRLQRAAELLQKSQMTVSEVAYEVGFNNPKYFSRYFKMEFNVLPSQYFKKAN